jgi:two-component system chemotaxis response regulator CheY
MALQHSTPVLIVDDERTMVDLMATILRKLRFETVDFATDGASALDRMQAKPYGLVISEMNMKPMGGLALLRAVRAGQMLRDTIFILTSASLSPENVIAAKRAGVDNYLLKPFT